MNTIAISLCSKMALGPDSGRVHPEVDDDIEAQKRLVRETQNDYGSAIVENEQSVWSPNKLKMILAGIALFAGGYAFWQFNVFPCPSKFL